MSLLPYVPPALSIYLLLISGVSKTYLKKEIEGLTKMAIDDTDLKRKHLQEKITQAGLDLEDEKKITTMIYTFWHDKTAVMQNMALDWSTRLSFFNSMFAAMASVFSIYSKTMSYESAAWTFFLLLAIFIPMLWWIISHDMGDLVAVKSHFFKTSPANVCRVVLIVVNVILIITIARTQQQPQPPAPGLTTP